MADWVAIKTEYVTTDTSYRKLAEKYGVNKDSIAKRAKSEGWLELKKTQADSIQTATIQKTAEKIADAESEIAAIKARTRLLIWAEIERRMGNSTEGLEGADFRRMVQNYCDMSNAEPGGGVLADTAKEDELSKSLRELGKELKSDD